MRFDDKAVRTLEQSYLTPEIVHQRERMLAHLSVSAGDSVLDVGCGVGLLTETLSDRVEAQGRIVACDQSTAMVEATRKRCATRSNVEVHEADVCGLPFQSASFDAVAIAQVLLYVEDPVRALAELRRVLRPGGVLTVVETDWRGVVIACDDDDLARRVFAAWDASVASPGLPCRLQPLIRDAGFSLDAVEAIPILNSSGAEESFSVPMVRDVIRMAARQDRISRDEADRMSNDIERRRASGEYLFCVNRFLFAAHGV